jgi:hypothetical protein
VSATVARVSRRGKTESMHRTTRRVLSAALASVAVALAIAEAGAVVCDRGGTLQKPGPKNGVPCPLPLTDAEKQQTVVALDRLQQTYFQDCARCLKNMLSSKRVCKCDADVGARTFASALPPSCNPELDGMCIGQSFFRVPVEVQACILAHEWLHMVQPPTLSYNCMQLEAFRLERDCLTNLGQANPKSPGYSRYVQMARLAEELSHEICPSPGPESLPALSEPRTGAKSRSYGGVNYSILSHNPTLYGIPTAQDTTFEYALAMTTPFNFVMAGSGLLVVSGLRDSSDTGILQTLAVHDGRVIDEIWTLELPGVHPFGLALDGARLYVLDTSQSRILVVEDGDGDSLPETLSPIPFARAIDFPVLQETLSIELLGNTGLILDPADRRLAEDLVEPDREFTILYDLDQDGTADATGNAAWRDFLTIIPGFVDLPRDTSAALRVLATAGAAIQLVLTDSTGTEDYGVLGSGGVPLSSNDGLVSLDVELVGGTYVRLDDVTNSISSYAALVNAEDVPVLLAYFEARRSDAGVVLRWGISGEAADHAGFHLHRQVADGDRERLTSALLSGRESYEFVDRDVPADAVRYWLEDLGRDGGIRWHGPVSVPAAGEPESAVPDLFQNSPNPFRGSTLLSFRTFVEGMVVLRVFDLAGREIARPLAGYLPAGHHEATWDGRDASGREVAAGTYFYRLDARGGSLTRKLVVL